MDIENQVENPLEILKNRQAAAENLVMSSIATYDGEVDDAMKNILRRTVLFKRTVGRTGSVGQESDLRNDYFFIIYNPLAISVSGQEAKEVAFKYAAVASVIASSIHAKNIYSTYFDFAGIGIVPPLEVAQDKEQTEIYYNLLNSIGNQIHAYAAASIKVALDRTIREYAHKIKDAGNLEKLPSPAQFQEDVFLKLYQDFGFTSVAAIPFGKKEQKEYKVVFSSPRLSEERYIEVRHLLPNNGEYADSEGKVWHPYSEEGAPSILTNDNLSKDEKIILFNPKNPLEKKEISASEHPLYRGRLYDKIVESNPIVADEMERFGITPSVVNRIFAIQLSKKFIRGMQNQIDRVNQRGYGEVFPNSFSEKGAKLFFRDSYANLAYAGKKVKNVLGRDRQLADDLDDVISATKKLFKAGVITDGDGNAILQNGRQSVAANYHHIGEESDVDLDNKEIADKYGFKSLNVGVALLSRTGDRFHAPVAKKEVTNLIVGTLDTLAASMNIPKENVGMDTTLSFGSDANQNRAAYYTPFDESLSITKGKLGAVGHEWFHAFDDKVYKQAIADGVITPEDEHFGRAVHAMKNYSGGVMMISLMHSAITAPENDNLTVVQSELAARLVDKLREYNPEMFEIASLFAGKKFVELDDGKRISMSEAADWYLNRVQGVIRVEADVSFHNAVSEIQYTMSKVRSYIGYMERNNGELPTHVNDSEGKIPTQLANGIRDILLHCGNSDISKRVANFQPFIADKDNIEGINVAPNPIDMLKAGGVSNLDIANAMTSGMRNLTAILESEDVIKQIHQHYIKTYQLNKEGNAQNWAESYQNITGEEKARMVEQATQTARVVESLHPAETRDRNFAMTNIAPAIVNTATRFLTVQDTKKINKLNTRENEDNIEERFVTAICEKTGLNEQSSILLKFAEHLQTSAAMPSNELLAGKFMQQHSGLVSEIIGDMQFLAANQSAVQEFVEIAQAFDFASEETYMSNPSELFARTGEAVLGERLKQLGMVNNNLTAVNLMRDSSDTSVRIITRLSYPSEAATKILTPICQKMINKELGYEDYHLDPSTFVEYHGNMTGSEHKEVKRVLNTSQLSLFDSIDNDFTLEIATPKEPKALEQKQENQQEQKKTVSFDMF